MDQMGKILLKSIKRSHRTSDLGERRVKLKKERKGNALTVWIQGAIAETCDFKKSFGELPPELVVNCKEISRITSTGTRAWITYFNQVTAKGVKLRFEECSTAMLEQCNQISNFTCGGEIASGYLPYCCQTCHTPFLKLFGIQELKAMSPKPSDLTCPKCGGIALFDDIPDEYLRFLTRN